MSTETTTRSGAVWDRVIDFGKSPSPAVASALLQLRFSAIDKKRMRELSTKARAGNLAADEAREADEYERLGCLLDILHFKARKVLKQQKQQ